MKKTAIPMVAEAPEATTPETLALIAVEILFEKKDCNGKQEKLLKKREVGEGRLEVYMIKNSL